MAELGRWLAKIAETPWQATQAVETWLQEQTNLPTPSEIVEYVRQAPTQAPKQQKVNCPICHGDGYESFWVLINYEFWEDTGRVKSRRIERIPPVPGHMQSPSISTSMRTQNTISDTTVRDFRRRLRRRRWR